MKLPSGFLELTCPSRKINVPQVLSANTIFDNAYLRVFLCPELEKMKLVAIATERPMIRQEKRPLRQL
jgi:hypothetical protein